MASIRTNVTLQELTEAEVIALQQLLIKLGYNPGVVDGRMGPQTQAAYARFLKSNGNGDPTRIDSGVSLLQEGDPQAWQVIVHGNEFQQPSTPKPYQSTPGTSGVPSTTPAAQPARTGTTSAPAAPQPYTPPAQGAIDDEVRKLYPNLAAYLDHPELGPILRSAAQNGWDAARLQGAVYGTNWWQTTSSNIRQWDLLQTQDPAEADRRVGAKTVEVMNAILRYGISMREQDARYVAGRVLREGWTDDQLLRFLGQTARGVGIVPGKLSQEAAKIQGLAQSYMVNLTEKDATEWATRVFEGTATMDTIESHLRLEAKNRFHWLSKQIDGGLTPDQLFGNIRNTVANILEIDPSNIDLNNPRWAALTAPIVSNSGTGEMRSMNYNEAMQWARTQPEWTRTKNAMDESAQIEMFLLRSLGAIK